MNWKSALAGSALALSAQAGMAAKSLPCPVHSPLVDTASVVQNDTKQRIANRLKTIDSVKRHQVVVITVNWLTEYGYESIEEMANAIGTNCKVGYRGEDTGVVVLYTKIPSRYRIETAKTERYITDVDSGRILEHSKSNGVCIKEDASCRLDDITLQIEQLITKQFPDSDSLLPLKNEIVRHDEIKSVEQTSDFLDQLGIGAVIVVVLWGIGYGGNMGIKAITRNNRRRNLKKRLFELNTELLLEKQKYPDWFLNQYAPSVEKTAEAMLQYSDEAIDSIMANQRKADALERDITFVRNTVWNWSKEYASVNIALEKAQSEVTQRTIKLLALQQDLSFQGFKFWSIEVPALVVWKNPAETHSQILGILKSLKSSMETLENIPKFYDVASDRIASIELNFSKLKADYLKNIVSYKEVFGKVPDIAINDLENDMNKFVADFRKAHVNKDIPMLRTFVAQSKNLANPLSDAVNMMVDELNWYNSIPFQIRTRQWNLRWMELMPKYERDALEYAKKTWKRTFLNYRMDESLIKLQWILDSVAKDYAQKKDLESLSLRLASFDMEYDKTKEYEGLGVTLAVLILEESLAAKRKHDEEERRKRQEEEDDRRRQRDEDDRRTNERNSSNDTSSNWSSGGGGGFSGGGATSD